MSRHPLHPALVHFPIAYWSLAVLTDFAGLWLGENAWRWSTGLLVAGCSMAVLAMLAGLMELSQVSEDFPLRDTYWHMGLMSIAFICFSLRLFLRLDGLQPLTPNTSSLLLDAGGFVSLFVGGWFGGKLVYQHGVGHSD